MYHSKSFLFRYYLQENNANYIKYETVLYVEKQFNSRLKLMPLRGELC